MKKKTIAISLMAVVFWTVLIFYFSSQDPSSSHSQSKATLRILQWFDRISDFSENGLFVRGEAFFRERILGGRYSSGNEIVRKSAHFGIYMVLGVFSTAFGYLYSKKYLIGIIMGVTLPVTIAVLDEYNQKFVGRTSSLEDVLLDGLGAIVGMGIALAVILVARGISRFSSKKSKKRADGG